jgi:hypothetical protein
MTCLRCAGFMVEYHLIDIDIGSAHCDERLMAWRCVNCGYISEAGMGVHRLATDRSDLNDGRHDSPEDQTPPFNRHVGAERPRPVRRSGLAK